MIGGSVSLLAEIEHERAVLDRFYQAGLFAYQKDQARWQQAMKQVLRADSGESALPVVCDRAVAPQDRRQRTATRAGYSLGPRANYSRSAIPLW